MERTYEDAVKALINIRGKAQQKQIGNDPSEREKPKQEEKLKEMEIFIERAGVKMEKLDQLSVIHISGTQGKGSTCAFTESILRHHGCKTGFYSSPHLREVRERIRINGKPLNKELFAKYFFDCYDNLQKTKDSHDGKMPAYFAFMTLMSFHVFLEEKVDVAVVEVGMGGKYDTTNIIKKPVVCGVTSLGMDHVKMLGPTLEDIAEHKAGIFKPGVPAFSVEQKEGALQRVFQRARELKIPFHVVPSKLQDYPGELPDLSLDWDHQQVNASMAIQLCNTWLKKTSQSQENGSQKEISESSFDEPDMKKPPVAATFEITANFRKGLQNTVWRGRCETLVRPNITFYLDGAHTPESVEVSAQWFRERADEEAKKTEGDVARVLLFNITKGRDPNVYLKPLVDLKFDHVVFSPNTISLKYDCLETTNFATTRENEFKTSQENQKVWIKFRDEGQEGHPMRSEDDDHVINDPYSTVFPCLTHAIQWIADGRDPLIRTDEKGDSPYPECLAKAARIQFLITGSLHLVGDVMKVLGSEITGEV